MVETKTIVWSVSFLITFLVEAAIVYLLHPSTLFYVVLVFFIGTTVFEILIWCSGPCLCCCACSIVMLGLIKIPVHLGVLILLIVDLATGWKAGLYDGFSRDKIIVLIVLEVIHILSYCSVHVTRREEHYQALPVKIGRRGETTNNQV
ncbi:hypothetical protein M3Y97_00643700 [Aphelenchoides bicaudatus]|nr:hypothetical protein M3Y97_00643700 [Aphelenchoides bicaudatus]